MKHNTYTHSHMHTHTHTHAHTRTHTRTHTHTHHHHHHHYHHHSHHHRALWKLVGTEKRDVRMAMHDHPEPMLVMCANDGHLGLLLNWACSLRAANIKMPKHVVFVTTDKTRNFLTSLGFTAFYHPKIGSYPSHASKKYSDMDFGMMMILKQVAVALSLETGYDVLFQVRSPNLSQSFTCFMISTSYNCMVDGSVDFSQSLVTVDDRLVCLQLKSGVLGHSDSGACACSAPRVHLFCFTLCTRRKPTPCTTCYFIRTLTSRGSKTR
jgi:hypothetical protein